jgi:heme-degrading monooxygenase HmoA
MYGTIRIYSGAAELADALVENQSEVKRIVGEIDGFQAYYLMRTADGAASFTVYDTEDGAQESNNVARSWVAENLPDLQVSAPQVAAGEVVINA